MSFGTCIRKTATNVITMMKWQIVRRQFAEFLFDNDVITPVPLHQAAIAATATTVSSARNWIERDTDSESDQCNRAHSRTPPRDRRLASAWTSGTQGKCGLREISNGTATSLLAAEA
ncbi:MAG TPA: hypothetical protein VM555_05015 [Tahibacter sp.]|nr:hypothetical protein [Tahibacter sp.]